MDCYNDFQNMVRSDNIANVIDRFRLQFGKECVTIETKRAMRDLLSVVDVLKNCKKESYPWIIKFSKILATFSPTQCGLFLHIIGGGALIEYAIAEGVSEQAVQQMWSRIVHKNPELKELTKRRSKNGTQRVLEGDVGQGSQSP